jgi:uncharacterized protein
MSLKNKLKRLKGHISHEGVTPPITKTEQTFEDLAVPFKEEWEKENVHPYFFDDDFCLIREVRYPISQHHGRYRFEEFLRAVKAWNETEVRHPLSSVGHDAEELFFFDTETTGLGGGVGNTIFLLGYASFKGNEVILRQHILPHPGAEVPLYQSFLEKINYRTLVTYNGKSFDWPQVKTRHTLVRDQVPKLPPFGHFDLYHAARRLWKHKLERLKLSVVEQEILNITRVDDVPGFLAPMIYFDFIESKRPDGMLGLLKHNEVDILSLITLYTHLSFQLLQQDKELSRKESFEVGRWFEYLGERNTAEVVYSQLTKGSDEESFKAKLALAYVLKKQHEWNKAITLFMDVAEGVDSPLQIEALIEAAKIYEHKLKNLTEAHSCCSVAIELYMARLKAEYDDKLYLQLQKRLERIYSKQHKFPG